MLDAVVDFLPAPNEVKAVSGILEDEEEGSREADDDELRLQVLHLKLQY